MIPGRLRYSIRIEEPSGNRSTSGQPVETWSEFATTRADIYSISGREYFEADQVNSETTVKIVIRYLQGLNTKMRIRHGDVIYKINAVLNQENRRRPVVIMCERQE